MFVHVSELQLIVISFLLASTAVDAQSYETCMTQRQEDGWCVPILSCGTIVQLLKRYSTKPPPSVVRYVRDAHCGTIGKTPHVCCKPSSVTEQPIIATPASVKPRAQEMEESSMGPSVQYSDGDVQTGMEILEAINCGNSDYLRVANGINAYLSEFPWMALLIYSDGVTRTMNCGGSLITDKYVVTAAHCIKTEMDKKIVSVRLGEHDIDTTIDCIGRGKKKMCAPPIQEIDVEEAIYHKDYNRKDISNDIGLIRLKSSATFQSNVQPICLPITNLSKEADLDRMLIAGWGRMEDGLKANVLQKAVVPVRSNEYCQNIHKLFKFRESNLCAGGENDVDTCKGDSGGPIFFPTRYRLGVNWVQFGVVSAGSIKCGSNYPGIYVRISSYLPWIAANIKP